MMKVFDYLKIVDIYGHDVKFRINGKESSQTILGGLLSIISFGVIITLGFLFAQDFFFRLNPGVSKIDYLLTNHINFTASVNTLPIAVDYEGDNLSGYFIISAYYRLYNPNNDQYTINKKVQLHICTKADFPQISQDLYDKRIPQGSLCFDDYNFNILGTYTDERIGLIMITFDKCDQTVYDCADEEEIIAEINTNSYFTLTIGNSILDPSNYTLPIHQYLQTNYVSPSNNFRKYVEIFIKQEVLETDDGIVLKSDKTQSAYAYYNERTSFNARLSQNLLAEFTIVSSNSISKTKRIYAKAQNVLAEVGGIVSIILVIAPFITKILADLRAEEAILNKIVYFDFSDKTSLMKSTIAINTKTNQPVKNGASSVTSLYNEKKMNSNNKEQQEPIFKPNTQRMIISKRERNESDINLKGLKLRPYHAIEFPRRKKECQNEIIHSQLEIKEEEGQHDITFPKTHILLTAINEFDKIELSKNIKTIANWKTSPNHHLYFSFSEVIKLKLFCCCKNNPRLTSKYLMYNKQLQLISNYLEVTNLLQRLEDLDKIKYI